VSELLDLLGPVLIVATFLLAALLLAGLGAPR
jgi:hypothetical protein